MDTKRCKCFDGVMRAQKLCPLCRAPITSHTTSDAFVREPTCLPDIVGLTVV